MYQNHLPRMRNKPAAVLVVGGGIGGMRASLDLADAGLKVFLIEETPCLGGRVAKLGFMFPQHDCVLCTGTPDHGYGCTRPSISPAYIQHNQHPNIEILTNTVITRVEGQTVFLGLTGELSRVPSLGFDFTRLCDGYDEKIRVNPFSKNGPRSSLLNTPEKYCENHNKNRYASSD